MAGAAGTGGTALGDVLAGAAAAYRAGSRGATGAPRNETVHSFWGRGVCTK